MVALLACILDVPGSKLGRDVDHSEFVREYVQSLQENSGQCVKQGQDLVLPHLFKFITQYKPIILCYIQHNISL